MRQTGKESTGDQGEKGKYVKWINTTLFGKVASFSQGTSQNSKLANFFPGTCYSYIERETSIESIGSLRSYIEKLLQNYCLASGNKNWESGWL